MQIWLPPMLSMLGALIVVVFSAWMSGRWITAETAKSAAEIRVEIAAMRGELASVRAEFIQSIADLELRMLRELTDIKIRLQRLEDHAGIPTR